MVKKRKRKYRSGEARLKRESFQRLNNLTRNLTIYKMREAGITYRKIGEKYGISKQRVYSIHEKYQRLLSVDNGYQDMVDLISIN